MRTLWLMHELPTGTPLTVKSGPVSGNPAWNEAIARFSSLLTISGHDHRSPIRNQRGHHRVGQTKYVNLGQSGTGPLHYGLVEAEFTKGTPCFPSHMRIAVWIDHTNAMSSRDMLNDEIAQQSCFARASLADQVNVSPTVVGPNAKRQGSAPAISFSKNEKIILHGVEASRASCQAEDAPCRVRLWLGMLPSASRIGEPHGIRMSASQRGKRGWLRNLRFNCIVIHSQSKRGRARFHETNRGVMTDREERSRAR